jgi:hypothetical protein
MGALILINSWIVLSLVVLQYTWTVRTMVRSAEYHDTSQQARQYVNPRRRRGAAGTQRYVDHGSGTTPGGT